MARFRNINDIVNQVAVEIGLSAAQDIFASTDKAFKQMIALGNIVGYELLQYRPWQNLQKEHEFTTVAGVNLIDLPADFGYMINQTGWELTANMPMGGPINAQTWAYRTAVGNISTIYASFRIIEGKLQLWPDPIPADMEIRYEYISRDWVERTETNTDVLTEKGDVPLYEPVLFERLLKLKTLEARGFDTTAALQSYKEALSAWAGYDGGAPVLNMSGWRGHRYLSGCNAPDSGYGH